MSDANDANNSLLTNLTNKVKYHAHKATYDPDANNFVKAQTQTQTQTQTQAQVQTTSDEETLSNTSTVNDNANPNTFNTKRFFTKIGSQLLAILKKGIFPFLALMIAMIVTNDMIVYSAPIRIIFFIFTFLVCYFVTHFTILLGLFYLLKGGYSYYYNNMTERPKKDIMPTIFALLPITTYKPMSSFSKFFLYPFTYPKTDQAEIKLPQLMKEYWDKLHASFVGFDRVKNLSIFTNNIKKIHQDLDHLHNTKNAETETAAAEAAEAVETAEAAAAAEAEAETAAAAAEVEAENRI